MDRHQNLYKDQRSHTPRLHSNINRELVDNNRAKQRRDRFQNSRSIFLSPERKKKKEILIPVSADNKENVNGKVQKQTLLAKIVSNATNPEKLKKEEDYIKKFIEWKNAQKEVKIAEKKKRFITSSSSGRQTATSTSLIPRGHHKEFCPPAGLKTVDQMKKEEENKNPSNKGRPSVYAIKPTPTKKQQQYEKSNKTTAKPTIPISLQTNTLAKSASKSKVSNNINSKTPGSIKSLNKQILSSNKNKNGIEKNAKIPTISKDLISKNTVNTNAKSTSSHTKKAPNGALDTAKKTPGNFKKGTLRNSPSVTTAKNTLIKVAKTIENSKSKITPVMQPLRKDLRPRALKMPPPPSAKIAAGAAGKFKTLAQKKAVNVKSPLKSARLGQSLKAKKPFIKKTNLPALKIYVEKIISTINDNEPNIKSVVQTPRDFATLNNLSEFVTSTKIKESSQNFKIDGISPIEISPKKVHSNLSAKRKILVKECNQQKPQKESKEESAQNIKKFNFLRYSEAEHTNENGRNKDVEIKEKKGLVNNPDIETKEKSSKNIKRFNFLRYSDAANTSNNDRNKDIEIKEKEDVVSNSDEEKTPVKFGAEERPANYLSPFVSVARGKVSLKAEKEKRNSIYLQNIGNLKNISTDINENFSNHSVEVRRTLEAVRYFRKQLQDEIDRLHQLCDIWEKFKKENMEKIHNANGEDMINVTIGQTRLLTSKKFMQFKGLIDRCEAGATGIGDVVYDGSEDTKPINSTDLEGFWSMLGLQIDNVDKRFENLNRWKANDWMDPDEIKPKRNNNLTKVKKPKTAPIGKSKPSSALQQMLRKMQAEMKRNKNDDMNDIVVLTSTNPNKMSSTNSSNPATRQSPNTSESRRLSLTVKDRKYFSPAPTVISFSSPNRRASLLRRNSSLESPKLLTDVQQVYNDLRKSVLLNENSRRMSLNLRSPKTKNINGDASPDTTIVNSTDNDFATKENIVKSFASQQIHSPDRTPVPAARKSILKTPGTARSRLRNVIFNDKLRVKKFNFLINDDVGNENADVTHEEYLAKSYEEELQNEESSARTLTLRNRKVRLRPSCEIVIPRK